MVSLYTSLTWYTFFLTKIFFSRSYLPQKKKKKRIFVLVETLITFVISEDCKDQAGDAEMK